MPKSTTRLSLILMTIPVLLLLPLIAMQFTSEVNWALGDFIAMGMLLLIVGLSIELILRNIKTARWRLMLCLLVLIVFLLVWAELAVGIFT